MIESGLRSPTRPPDAGQIQLLIADAMPLFADALGLALRNEKDLEILSDPPATGLQAIEQAERRRPDVVLVDYWMSDMEGAAVARMILSRHPNCKVIVLSWFYGATEIQNSLDAGAVGFFPKTLKVDQVAEGIRRAQQGESPVYLDELEGAFRTLRRRSADSVALWKELEVLSTREMSVLYFLGSDMTVEEVANRLGISPQTVRVHMRNMLSKTGTGSYKELVVRARKCGLIR